MRDVTGARRQSDAIKSKTPRQFAHRVGRMSALEIASSMMMRAKYLNRSSSRSRIANPKSKMKLGPPGFEPGTKGL
jgi:hypothetical protein